MFRDDSPKGHIASKRQPGSRAPTLVQAIDHTLLLQVELGLPTRSALIAVTLRK